MVCLPVRGTSPTFLSITKYFVNKHTAFLSLRETLSDPRSSRGEGDEAIPVRSLTAFGMTLCVRLLHGVYTEYFAFLRTGSANVFAMTVETP